MKPIVFNLDAPFVDLKTGKLLPPWNSFFQLFTQAPTDAIEIHDALVSLTLHYEVSQQGTIFVDLAAPGNLLTASITRGNTVVPLGDAIRSFTVSINDVVDMTFGGGAKVYFFP